MDEDRLNDSINSSVQENRVTTALVRDSGKLTSHLPPSGSAKPHAACSLAAASLKKHLTFPVCKSIYKKLSVMQNDGIRARRALGVSSLHKP
eukprot:scaffold207209_cov18-Tisochrysis_lutea.AAC.1